MKKGIGLACIHYGVEVPKGAQGNYFLKWIGGYFGELTGLLIHIGLQTSANCPFIR